MTVVAIDFGTSNTVVCTQDPVTQMPRTLKFEHFSRRFETASGQVNMVPSLVFVKEDGRLVVGERVRQERLGFAQPQRLFQAFKRDLAAEYQPPPRQIDGSAYTPEIVSERFLQTIWQQLSHLSPTQVIFTVPVGAFERYLNWFRDFAAQLNVSVRLVDESTAAALGYAVQHSGSVVLVIDFGGGTLDLSLVRTVAGSGGQQVLRAEVLAKSDAYVGGVDIDSWIVEHHLQQIGSSRSEVEGVGWLNLLEMAEKLKIKLSTVSEAKESWFDDENFMSHELQLSREELEDILETRQALEQIRQALDELLGMAQSKGIGKAAIEQVLLVGGSCQIPAVQQLVTSYFGRQRVKLDKPFDAVARGALALGQVEVEDYLRHRYAIRLWETHTRDYSYFPLFDKGTKYPCVREESLMLQVATEGQREIRLDVGEVAEVAQAEVSYDAKGRMTSSWLNKQAEFRPLVETLQATSVCVAHLDPLGQTGVDRIEVAFEVNEQRVLLATVRDLLTAKLLVDRGAIAKLV